MAKNAKKKARSSKPKKHDEETSHAEMTSSRQSTPPVSENNAYSYDNALVFNDILDIQGLSGIKFTALSPGQFNSARLQLRTNRMSAP